MKLGFAFAALLSLTACVPAPPPPEGAAAEPAIERTPDGKPDLNGIWQALATANWDIRPHEARPAPLFLSGSAPPQP